MEITITYKWHRSDGKTFDPEGDEAFILTEEAEARIFKLRGETFTGGLLQSTITDGDGKEVEYHGEWSVKKS